MGVAVALRKMETIWNSCHALGTGDEQELKAGVLSDWEEDSSGSRCDLAL